MILSTNLVVNSTIKTQTIEEVRGPIQEEMEIEEAGGGYNAWVMQVSGAEDEEDMYPQPVRLISGKDLMEKSNMDAYGIIHLIKSHNLVAHDSIYSTDINKHSFNPAIIAELTAGDLDRQKLSMQRLRFDPAVVNEFERKHPKLFGQVETSNGYQESRSENNQMTEKELVIQSCQEAARKLVAENPQITLKQIVAADEIKNALKDQMLIFLEKAL